MKTQLLSISKIFTEKILRIPDYQRGYAWTEKELRDFWNDLVQLEDGRNHYTGVLTLEEVPESIVKQWNDDYWIISSKNYEPYYIVDGQQRLTTTIILIQAITECIPEEEKLNFTSSTEIRKKFIFDSKNEGISRSYLFGYDKDNPSYEFLKTRIFQEPSDSSIPIQGTIYTHNLEFAKIFFLGKLKTLSFTQIEQIYRKLTQNFLFNLYTISDDIDVFVAFETMNNRGKLLSHLELLKTRLIYLSTKFKAEDFEKQKLRNSINEGWKSIYHFLGRNKGKILDDDIFLSSHFSLYFRDTQLDMKSFREIRYRRLHSNRHYTYGDYLLEEIFTQKNIAVINPDVKKDDEITIEKIYNYVQNLKNSVEHWYYILNPSDSNFSDEEKTWLEKINRLPNAYILSVAPILMSFMQNEVKGQVRVRFYKAIERFLFVSTLTRYGYVPDFEQPKLFELISKFNKKEVSSDYLIKEIDDFVDTFISRKDNIEDIISNLKNGGFYKWIGLKYFLYEYEMSLKNKTKTYREKINWYEFENSDISDIEDEKDYITVEHIYPQKPKKGCWTSQFENYSDKEKRLLKNSLGNLVPLSERKNIALENDCFVAKKQQTGKMVGYKYGSYSEIEIADFDDWTAKEILERGLKLLAFWERRWNFNFGDTLEKAKFLHIEFVLQKEI